MGPEMEMWLSAVLAAVPSFSFGYQLGAPDAAAPALRACPPTNPACFPVDTTSPEWGLSVGQMCVGALIGSLVFGRLCDRLGRKMAILAVNVVYTAGLLVTWCAGSLWWFAVGRAVVGVAVGASCVAVPVYLSDLVGRFGAFQWRGVIGSFHQMAIVLGYLAIQVLALQVDGLEWRWLYGVNLGVCIAHTVLFTIFGLHLKADSIDADEKLSITEVIKCDAARQSLTVACLLHIAQQLSGINGVFSYAGELFKGTWWVPLALSILNVLMTVVSMSLMERLGRRPLLLSSVALCIVSLLSATAATFLLLPTIASLSILLFVGAFAVGLGPIPWLMIAELFPPHAVAPAVSLAVATNWTFNFAVTSGFPVVSAWLGGGKFVPFVVVLVVFLWFAWKRVPETRGRAAGYM